MNSLVLLLTAAVAFIFGYRFYSKLLALGVFRPQDNYSTAAQRGTERTDGAAHRFLAFGHHLATLAAGVAITGSLVSLIWGWVPAFLWIVVGTVIGAGTYGIGSVWLSLRHPGLGAAEIAAQLMGRRAYLFYASLSFILLLIINAACATLAAQLLTAFPSTVLPLVALVVIALLLGIFLRGREDFEIIPASLIALTLALMAVWLLGKFPLSFQGALALEIPGVVSVSLDATIAWVVLLLTYGYHATRLPSWRLARPCGYLTALLLFVVLFIFCLGIVMLHPVLVAPQSHTAPDAPDVIPWLFITLSSGAIAGFHLLIANGITAPQLKRQTDARFIGYGGALGLGLLALSAVILGSIGFNNTSEWEQHYVSWESLKNLRQVLDTYINSLAQLAGGLGLGMSLSRNVAALTILGLLIATFEAGLRLQARLLTEFGQRHEIALLKKEKLPLKISVLLCAVLTLHDGHGHGGLALWPVFGAVDQALAIFTLALLAVALRRAQRPVGYVLAPMAVLLITLNWVLAVQLLQWRSNADWLPFSLGILLFAVEMGVLFFGLKALKPLAPPQT